MVVGGHAYVLHVQSRYTKDLDVWVRPTPQNLERLRLASLAFANVDFLVSDALTLLETNNLGFPLVGLAPNLIKVLLRIKAVDFETLRTVPDVGEKVAQSLITYFQDEDALYFIDKLQAAGLNFVEENSEKQAESDSLAGKLFLYTGSFLNFSRTELEDKIESNGGKLTSGVSKKLDFLIVGSEPGPSKINKAEQLGVKMISESEFQAML